MLKIKKIKENSRVYDITVKDNHNFFANDILVHNCIEILEYVSKDEVAVCNLASICLPKFVTKSGTYNHKHLHNVCYIATKNLNRVIDKNYYPVEEAKRSNFKHRPIALGVQGLADVYFMLGIAFESEEARNINKAIFETIYHAAVTASIDMAKEEGHYESYQGSPASEGLLQFDHWGVTPSDRYDWNKTKEDLKKYGLRNSLLTAIMPTASCFVSSTRIQTTEGVKSYQQILTDNDIDWKHIESQDEQAWFKFKEPILVNTRFGPKKSNKIFYNGYVETLLIELVDGSIFECSENHKFLVDRNSLKVWVEAKDLINNDAIINIDDKVILISNITKGSLKPTWDISVEEVQEFLLENGCVSHNTSSIYGNQASTEPQTSNLERRQVLAGEFIVVNKHLVKELVKRKIWSEDVRQQIMRDNGSIQKIDVIPNDIKEIYKTAYEVKQKSVIDQACDRAPYIDQTQSMNLFVDNPNFAKLTAMHFYAWGRRDNPNFDKTKPESEENPRYIRLKQHTLKTGMYYLRSKAAADAVKFTVNNDKKPKTAAEEIACSLDSPDDCEACSA